MFKFLKKALGGTDDSDEAKAGKENLARAASVSGIDRRAHIRIAVPDDIELEILPEIYFEGKKIKASNIGMGGLQVSQSYFSAPPQSGTLCEMIFRWQGTEDTITQKVKVLRKVGNHYHLKYDDLATELIVKCSMAFKAGERGARVVPVKKEEYIANHGHVIEMWRNQSGDFLVHFEKENKKQWEIQYSNRKYLLNDGSPRITYQDNEAPKISKEDLILFVYNIGDPSPLLQKLLKQLSQSLSA